MLPPRRLLLFALIPGLLLAAGTAGYCALEGWPPLDSLYVTVVTLTTIGYSDDLAPKTAGGKLFTMALALGGVFTLFYLAADFIRAVVSGEVRTLLGKQRMERTLAELKDHLIVCGYGRMGRLVCREFAAQGIKFVVIDRDEEALEDFAVPHGVALEGDATSDGVLRSAGVERARALVAVTPSDADNLYITMSARLLNDRLFIVARAESENAHGKLERAGANRVVSPYVIGGSRVAQAVLRPTVVDFIELATRTEHMELQIEESRVGPSSPLAGATLKDSRIRADLKVIVVAIKKGAGEMVFNPAPETLIEAGDIIVAIGDRKHLDEMEQLANRQGPA